MDNESRRKSQSGVAVIDAGAAWARGLDPRFLTAAIMATTAIAHTPAATAQVVSRRLRMRHFYASRAQATSAFDGRTRAPRRGSRRRGLFLIVLGIRCGTRS